MPWRRLKRGNFFFVSLVVGGWGTVNILNVTMTVLKVVCDRLSLPQTNMVIKKQK